MPKDFSDCADDNGQTGAYMTVTDLVDSLQREAFLRRFARRADAMDMEGSDRGQEGRTAEERVSDRRA